MNKTECNSTCVGVPFGKCNYDNNTCDPCKQGDKDCIYTMAYCKVAQKAGRCKRQELAGLFRKIQVNKNYKEGEFDLLFKFGKMYAQYYDTKIETKELGDVKTTGAAAGGGVTF